MFNYVVWIVGMLVGIIVLLMMVFLYVVMFVVRYIGIVMNGFVINNNMVVWLEYMFEVKVCVNGDLIFLVKVMM